MKMNTLSVFKLSTLSCVLLFPAPSSYSQDKQFIKLYDRYLDKEFGYSILKPGDWSDGMRSDEEGRNYRVFNGPREKEDILEPSLSVIISDADEETVEQYTNDLLVSYTKLFQEFKLESRKTILIDGVTFGDFTISFDMEDSTYRMRTVYTIENDMLYHLNALAPIEYYDRYRDTLNDMIGSFTVVE